MRKNICLIVYNFADYGGVNAVASSLANELSKHHSVSLVSVVDDGRKDAYALDDAVKSARLMPLIGDLKKDLIKLRKPALKYFKDNKIDIAVLLGHYPGFLIGFYAALTKTKLIFADHGALMNQWDEKNVRAMRKIASKFCKFTVTLTKRSMDDYIEKFNISKSKIDYIYNWLDLSLWDNNSYDDSSKKIISAGRFGAEKGFDRLIKAFAKTSKLHPDWKLDLYGDGELLDECKNIAKEEGVNDSVHFMGAVSSIQKEYPKYSMYVMPSYREGLPLVLLEAKAASLPVISYDILTGPAEIVRDGVDGILVKDETIDALSEAMNYLIENDSIRKAMASSARENLSDFSKEEILNKWLALFDKIGNI